MDIKYGKITQKILSTKVINGGHPKNDHWIIAKHFANTK